MGTKGTIVKKRKQTPNRSTKRIYYDTETSGLSHPFDQILQICLAYVCDDYNITNILIKRVKRLPWVIPSPSAMLVTGIDGKVMEEQGEPHYKVMKEIQDWIEPKMPRITFVGHNILGFDESVLRHNFHQNLLNPYITSTRGCARFDTMKAAMAISVYAPDKMNFENPEQKGKTSFNLGNLLHANGIPFDKNAAHDAIVDVRGTIALDKFMAETAPEIYAEMERNSTKAGVREFVSQNRIFAYTVAFFGRTQTAIVAPIPKNFTHDLLGEAAPKDEKMTREEMKHFKETQRHDHRQVIFDLNFDPEPYMNMTLEQIADLMPDRQREKARKDKTKSPFKYFRDNTQPILASYDLVLDDMKTIPEEELKARADKIARNRDFHAKVTKALMLSSAPREKSDFIEEQIYDSFPSDAVKRWCDRFHASDWEKRMDMVKTFNKDFAKELRKDPSFIRYKGFAKRIIFAEAPRDLIERDPYWKKMIKPFQKDMLARIAAPEVIETPHGNTIMTVGGALQEVIKLMDKVIEGDKRFGDPAEVMERLDEIADYLQTLLPEDLIEVANQNRPRPTGSKSTKKDTKTKKPEPKKPVQRKKPAVKKTVAKTPKVA